MRICYIVTRNSAPEPLPKSQLLWIHKRSALWGPEIGEATVSPPPVPLLRHTCAELLPQSRASLTFFRRPHQKCHKSVHLLPIPSYYFLTYRLLARWHHDVAVTNLEQLPIIASGRFHFAITLLVSPAFTGAATKQATLKLAKRESCIRVDKGKLAQIANYSRIDKPPLISGICHLLWAIVTESVRIGSQIFLQRPVF